MKVSDTFWLTIISQFQHAFVYVSVILFFLVPKVGRRQYIEFGAILIFSLICETGGWIGVLVFHANMNLLSSLLTIIFFPLLILLYLKQPYWRNWRVVAYITIAAFTIFAVVNLFYIQGVSGGNSYPRAVASFFYLIIGITYLFGYMGSLPKEVRAKHPMYWFSIAIVFYNSVVVYLAIWMDYLVKIKNSRLIEVFMIHNSIGAVYYMIFWYALILMRREYTVTQPSA
ncbi:MAG TPA: hypothetical protein VFE50_06530 [Cyclobacteriaceae bacterium]|nr:hypothetical protein [Cyclobacteriaceae bacterium]